MAPTTAGRSADRRLVLTTIVVVVLLMVTYGAVHAATFTVASVNFRFEPETRTAKVGDVVRWTFAGDPHTVTSGAPGAPDGRFDSGIKNPGDTYQLTLASAGTFPYFCAIHPEQMFGTIVVASGPTATPRPTVKATPKPTAKPTPRPTARPTAPPTARPSARPTAAPTATATSEATPSPVTTQPATPTPSATPSPSVAATPSNTGGAASPSPAPSAAPDPGAPAAALDPLPIVAAALLLIAAVGGGLALARRSGKI